ncbi:phage tail tube protein [Ahrensia sp. R2A130]|uniref:phage tail tube protein n=1 Tax=Ahrensia sp. R2A130 TaxID=744979 RepID=UPI0001E0B512|nr:phage tail tube protein [Ahrensia sp. R2A130]EFL88288.1 conserved hypothetical protein [Ahrensia sp. R2A130]
MDKFGGEMDFRMGDGSKLTLRGAFTNMPSNFTSESVTNQDGSVDKVGELKPFKAEVTFKDTPGTDWNRLVREVNLEATLAEEYTGVVHSWTGAHFEGEPSIDRANGEVSGLTFASPSYRVRDGL